MSVFSDGGGWYIFNGYLVKVPPWNPLIGTDAIRSQLLPIPDPWRASAGKLIGLASMEAMIPSLPAPARNTLMQAFEHNMKDLIHGLVAGVTNGSKPAPDDSGDPRNPFGPYGPGGPHLQIARFLLDVAAELQGGRVRDALVEQVGRLGAAK